jgi:hypothetical protein
MKGKSRKTTRNTQHTTPTQSVQLTHAHTRTRSHSYVALSDKEKAKVTRKVSASCIPFFISFPSVLFSTLTAHGHCTHLQFNTLRENLWKQEDAEADQAADLELSVQDFEANALSLLLPELSINSLYCFIGTHANAPADSGFESAARRAHRRQIQIGSIGTVGTL